MFHRLLAGFWSKGRPKEDCSGEGHLSDADALLKAIPELDPAVLAPKVIELWPSLDEETRQQLREEARNYGWEAYFIVELEDGDLARRVLAVDILGLIGGRHSLWPLLGALASKKEAVCFSAADALKQLQAPGLIEIMIDALAVPERWLPARVGEIILARGREAVMPLLERLPDAPKASKGYIIELLGELGDVRAVPFLINAVEDENMEIRAKGASALAKINGPVAEVTDSVLQALEDEAWEVRAQAALAAGNMGIKEAAPTLEKLMADSDWRVKEHAKRAIELLR